MKESCTFCMKKVYRSKIIIQFQRFTPRESYNPEIISQPLSRCPEVCKLRTLFRKIAVL